MLDERQKRNETLEEKRRSKRRLHRQERHDRKIKTRLGEYQIRSDAKTGIEIIDVAKVGTKNRIILCRNVRDILGVIVGDEIAIIKHKKRIHLVKLANIKIEY